MIIIVEGVDRVGKTTLVNKLVESGYTKFEFIENLDKINSQDFELTKIVETEKIYATFSALKLLDKLKADIVVDRFHLSEYVYGYLNRFYINDEVFKIDDLLSELNILLIYVTPLDIEKSSLEHGSSLHEHLTLFEEMFKITSINHKIKCSYNDIDIIARRLTNENRHS